MGSTHPLRIVPFASFFSCLAVAAALSARLAAAQAPPTPSPSGAQSQDEALGESYVEGSTYAGGARIALDADGHLFSVQAGNGRMPDFGETPLFVVLATVSGPNAPWSFSFGKASSGLTLLVDGQRYAPIEAQFAVPVVSQVDPATKPERSRQRADGATVVVDTTEHPLAILFRLPGKALRTPEKTLSLRQFAVAGRTYNFDLRFAD